MWFASPGSGAACGHCRFTLTLHLMGDLCTGWIPMLFCDCFKPIHKLQELAACFGPDAALDYPVWTLEVKVVHATPDQLTMIFPRATPVSTAPRKRRRADHTEESSSAESDELYHAAERSDVATIASDLGSDVEKPSDEEHDSVPDVLEGQAGVAARPDRSVYGGNVLEHNGCFTLSKTHTPLARVPDGVAQVVLLIQR